MKSRKIVIGIVAIAMVLPAFNTLNYDNSTENIIQANAETINGLDSEKYQELTNEVFRLLNEYRISQGIEPVKSNPLMMEMAQQRAKEQEETGLSHDRPDGSSCFSIFTENDVNYSLVGENISMGYTSPEGAITGWKNSELHNANMLDSNFTHVGIGVTYYNGSYYWVQLFAGTTDDKITSNDYLDTDITTTETTTVTTEDITTTSQDVTTTPEDTTTTQNIVDDNDILIGDVSGDNEVKSNDLLILKKHLLGIEELSNESLKYADVNGDGEVKSNDLLLLKKILLGVEE